jgi:hypothetical protein
MPATTFIPNTNAVIKLDNSGGSLTDVSDYVSTATVDMSASIGKFSVFGETGTQASEGKRDVTAALGVRPAEDSAGASYSLNGWAMSAGTMGRRTLEIDVPDSTSASFRISCECYLTAWQIFNQDAGGDGTPSTQTASLQFDGLPTYSVL